MHCAGCVFFRGKKSEVNDPADFLAVGSTVFNVVDGDFLIDPRRFKSVKKAAVYNG